MLEHPAITRVNRTGYARVIEFPRSSRLDYFGDEIEQGDEVVFDPEKDHVVKKVNLETYLEREYGFDFQLAE